MEKSPTAASYVLLGDAYMAIEEPERALEIYEQVMGENWREIGRNGRNVIKEREGEAIFNGGQAAKFLDWAFKI